MPDCFLCDPSPDLLYKTSDNSVAMCGLGPIVPGYSVIAPRRHAASCADLVEPILSDFVSLVDSARQALTERFGPCLITEHGRVPTCAPESTHAEPHCYHAHLLVFPNAPDVEQEILQHFARREKAMGLSGAFKLGRKHQEYFLFSPSRERFFVLTRPGRMMRQFARFLIAGALGKPELANWRRFPMREVAACAANELRLCLAGERECHSTSIL
jgi:diadenosine tetraphosphate (Ap4A) HIT family hydrolase